MTTGFYTPGASHAPRNLHHPHLCTALEVVVPGGNPRSRGFPPKLSNAQSLTMEFVGAFLGYHGDQAIGEDWRRHGATGFPHLGDRSTFVRQLANLWQIKALLHQHWAGTLGAFEAPVHLVDGFPVPVCHPKRVSRHTVFRGEADWGFCASKDPYEFGLRHAAHDGGRRHCGRHPDRGQD